MTLGRTGRSRRRQPYRQATQSDHGYAYLVATRDHHIDPGSHFADKPDFVDICGIATDYCVGATALDSVREGLETTVLLDLTAAVAPNRVPEITAELAAAEVAIQKSA